MASKQSVQTIARSQLNRHLANSNAMRTNVNVNKLDRMALWRGGRSQNALSPFFMHVTPVRQPPHHFPKTIKQSKKYQSTDAIEQYRNLKPERKR